MYVFHGFQGPEVGRAVGRFGLRVGPLLEAFDLGTSKFDDWMTRWLPGLMTGSAGTAVDVLVSCDSSNGRRVWEEWGRKIASDSSLWVSAWISVNFFRVSKSVAGAILWTHLGEKRVPRVGF